MRCHLIYHYLFHQITPFPNAILKKRSLEKRPTGWNLSNVFKRPRGPTCTKPGSKTWSPMNQPRNLEILRHLQWKIPAMIQKKSSLNKFAEGPFLAEHFFQQTKLGCWLAGSTNTAWEVPAPSESDLKHEKSSSWWLLEGGAFLNIPWECSKKNTTEDEVPKVFFIPFLQTQTTAWVLETRPLQDGVGLSK